MVEKRSEPKAAGAVTTSPPRSPNKERLCGARRREELAASWRRRERAMEFWSANSSGSWASALNFLKQHVRATAGAQIQIVGLQETGLLDENWNAEVAASRAGER